jgi:hypothetical protein
VVHGAHELQLAVLVPPVLQNLLDGHRLPSLQALGLHGRSSLIR